MALTWDLTSIVDYETVCFEPGATSNKQMRGVTTVIIFGTMFVGINRITEQTASEYHARLLAFHTVSGIQPIKCQDPDTGSQYRHVTLAEIRAHIGLQTNAATMSKALFVRKLGETILSEAEYQTAREKDPAS